MTRGRSRRAETIHGAGGVERREDGINTTSNGHGQKMKKTLFILSLAVLASSSTSLARSNSKYDHLRANRTKSRWLSYNCESDDNNRRNRSLLHRFLTHTCDSQQSGNQLQSTASNVYDYNSSSGSNSFLIIACGIIAGLAVLYSALFFADPETFTEVTGQSHLVPSVLYHTCKCQKRQIDKEDEDVTNFERDMAATVQPGEEPFSPYLTKETIDYLAEKQNQIVDRVERPKKLMFHLYRKCIKPSKVYDEEDKYRIPDQESEDDSVWQTSVLSKVGNVGNTLEEIRLKMCWKPAKQFGDGDKYELPETTSGGDYVRDEDDKVTYVRDVDGKVTMDEMQKVASSYESGGPTSPWYASGGPNSPW